MELAACVRVDVVSECPRLPYASDSLGDAAEIGPVQPRPRQRIDLDRLPVEVDPQHLAQLRRADIAGGDPFHRPEDIGQPDRNGVKIEQCPVAAYDPLGRVLGNAVEAGRVRWRRLIDDLGVWDLTD